MSPQSRFRHVRNPLTLFGIWLTTVSAILFLVVFFADLFGLIHNPYLGILFFLVLPGFFVVGLLMMPLGIYFSRRREHRGPDACEYQWPVWDFNLAAATGAPRRSSSRASLVNVLVISLAAYRGVEYMDSPQFCGQVCHTVMKPEFTAYQNGPHARVACVSCHIGPGAHWFVKSKLSGHASAVRRRAQDLPDADPVARHEPAPGARDVRGVPLAREVHGRPHPHGHASTRDDEAITESTTTLRLHVGSGSEKLGATGIHWHMAPSTRVTYITTDPKRQTIPYVKVEDADGRRASSTAPRASPTRSWRGASAGRWTAWTATTGPSHRFDSTPESAVDDALAHGGIARTLPFARREAVAALKGTYPTQDAAAVAIARRLTDFYRGELKDQFAARQKDIDRAVATTQAIYQRNIFPEMNVVWGTYPNNLGHTDFPGCFRCHDDSHKAKDGSTIRQDCELCHKQES